MSKITEICHKSYQKFRIIRILLPYFATGVVRVRLQSHQKLSTRRCCMARHKLVGVINFQYVNSANLLQYTLIVLCSDLRHVKLECSWHHFSSFVATLVRSVPCTVSFRQSPFNSLPCKRPSDHTSLSPRASL
jgi:hypothetical protein